MGKEDVLSVNPGLFKFRTTAFLFIGKNIPATIAPFIGDEFNTVGSARMCMAIGVEAPIQACPLPYPCSFASALRRPSGIGTDFMLARSTKTCTKLPSAAASSRPALNRPIS